jgi:replicative DNA helicase
MSENHSFDHKSTLESSQNPPNSVQAEQAVLRSLMLNNQNWDLISDKVEAGDFYRSDHQLIFRSIEKLAEKPISFDAFAVSEALDCWRNKMACQNRSDYTKVSFMLTGKAGYPI